jgi:hypothetical protein
MATAALVCGIVGLVLFFMFVVSVVALVLGLIAASHAKRSPGVGSGLGRARAGWIMGAIGVAGFVALMVGAALTGGFESDDIAVQRLDVGDCVDLADVSGPFEVVEELPRRDCDEPHDAEVYLVDTVTNEGDAYPGEATLTSTIERMCTGQAFEDYVGVSYGLSSLELFYLYPTEESWGFGDRSYTCMAATADGSPLQESVEGSGS